jgi:hypothetical protein
MYKERILNRLKNVNFFYKVSNYYNKFMVKLIFKNEIFQYQNLLLYIWKIFNSYYIVKSKRYKNKQIFKSYF